MRRLKSTKTQGMRCTVALVFTFGQAAFAPPITLAGESVVYDGAIGAGQGKHVVLLTGDEEYRSEEGLVQLGKILAFRHGFRATVLSPSIPRMAPLTQMLMTHFLMPRHFVQPTWW